ncbi:sulfatase-like hydrolase/transferase [Opitutia bacterium ISCC 51]|nr:sulfatase-like hydrolase/transferase [Opitutae bacterium ISCC 51]QXD29939.1 sulfatase-like hydrolase/transferase [Opitutae bacterium ISCC 52]
MKNHIGRIFLAFLFTAFLAQLNGKPLNVILILCDDVGFECFSSYGSKEYHTPRLDQLAAEGIRFENCHSTPLCTPSRVNLMSGKSNVFNYYNFGVYPKEEPTFANHFKSQGYKTAVAGKWQLLLEDKGITPTEAGFDTYCLWNMPLTERARYWNPSLDQNGKLLDLPDGSYGPTVVNDFILDFIRENKDEPFLVYNPLILPHNPFPPTPHSTNQEETDDKKNFVDMVEYIDFLVGRIVDTLEELGLRENTLIVFTSDNGTNQVLSSEFEGRQIQGGKGYTHDYGTRVPMIANFPGRIPVGQVNSDLIAFSDFFPTMVEAAGLKPKSIRESDGWSFWPQCIGESGTKRDFIYGYYFPRPYAKQFDSMYNHWEVRYARDKRYKLYGNGDLFDTQKDVLEKSPSRPGAESRTLSTVRKRLQKALDSYPSEGQGVDREKVNGKLPKEMLRSPKLQ